MGGEQTSAFVPNADIEAVLRNAQHLSERNPQISNLTPSAVENFPVGSASL